MIDISFGGELVTNIVVGLLVIAMIVGVLIVACSSAGRED